MRPHLIILAATLAAIPIAAAAAQQSGSSEQGYGGQQPMSQTQPPQGDQPKPATADDLKAGAKVYDQAGEEVGTVDSVDADGVVVSTGSARVKIPQASFVLGSKGLVIGATKAQLEAEAKKAEKPKE